MSTIPTWLQNPHKPKLATERVQAVDGLVELEPGIPASTFVAYVSLP